MTCDNDQFFENIYIGLKLDIFTPYSDKRSITFVFHNLTKGF